jgi:acetyl-CoA acetyltransferase family protein
MVGPHTYFLFKDGLNDTFINTDMMGTAENVARLYGITREEIDEFALLSQQRAFRAQENGALAREITPITITRGKKQVLVDKDEGIRPNTTAETLAALRAVKPNGFHTAGNSSNISDGAGALIMTTRRRARELGMEPVGTFISWGTAGVDPRYMGLGPVPACKIAMKRAGMTLKDINYIEINEAFGGQYIAVERELGLDRENVNIKGGAIALGHPLGATGARLVISLLNLGGVGMASACIGGGQGGAIIIESYIREE